MLFAGLPRSLGIPGPFRRRYTGLIPRRDESQDA